MKIFSYLFLGGCIVGGLFLIAWYSERYRGFTQPFGVFMAADPDPYPFSDPFGVATREVRIHFRIRFGVADRIRFRIRIRIRFQLKNRLTTAKVQRECCEELNMCMT